LLKFFSKIHGIYLYGSVATGKAKSLISHLNLVVVLKTRPTIKLKIQLKKLENSLSQKYKKVYRKVGFAITYKNEVLRVCSKSEYKNYFPHRYEVKRSFPNSLHKKVAQIIFNG